MKQINNSKKNMNKWMNEWINKEHINPIQNSISRWGTLSGSRRNTAGLLLNDFKTEMSCLCLIWIN